MSQEIDKNNTPQAMTSDQMLNMIKMYNAKLGGEVKNGTQN